MGIQLTGLVDCTVRTGTNFMPCPGYILWPENIHVSVLNV